MSTQELAKKHRPKTIKSIVGQEKAKDYLLSITRSGEIPHCLLLTGPTGCGKTTICRILKEKLEVSKIDYEEINAAQNRGIDKVRDIQSKMSLSPLGGAARIYAFDECHMLTKEAQNSLLKMLEDTPDHVYFILLTTDPQQLLATIRSRSSVIKLEFLKPSEIQGLIERVLKREKKSLTEDVMDALVNAAEGSARQSLVLLEQVLAMRDSDEDRIEFLEGASSKKQAIELCRLLMRHNVKWPQVASLIKELDEDPESLRWMILGYMSSVVLGGGKMAKRCYMIIEAFRDNFYDSKKAGLIAACFEVVHGE